MTQLAWPFVTLVALGLAFASFWLWTSTQRKRFATHSDVGELAKRIERLEMAQAQLSAGVRNAGLPLGLAVR